MLSKLIVQNAFSLLCRICDVTMCTCLKYQSILYSYIIFFSHRAALKDVQCLFKSRSKSLKIFLVVSVRVKRKLLALLA